MVLLSVVLNKHIEEAVLVFKNLIKDFIYVIILHVVINLTIVVIVKNSLGSKVVLRAFQVDTGITVKHYVQVSKADHGKHVNYELSVREAGDLMRN